VAQFVAEKTRLPGRGYHQAGAPTDVPAV